VHAAGGNDRLLDVPDVGCQFVRQFGDAGAVAQGLGKFRLNPEHAGPQVLDVPRWPDHPTAVPEVPLELAVDSGGGISGKAVPFGLVEAPGCLDQAEVRHLVQVGAFPAAGLEAARQGFGKVQVLEDELVFEGFAELAGPGLRGTKVRDVLVRQGAAPQIAGFRFRERRWFHGK